MHGYQLTFFTQQDPRHHGVPLGEWLIAEACRLKISGATLITADEGFGQNRKIHSAHFFEMADRPIEITMAVNKEDAECLFSRLQEEGIQIFYIKTPIEFGLTGAS